MTEDTADILPGSVSLKQKKKNNLFKTLKKIHAENLV